MDWRLWDHKSQNQAKLFFLFNGKGILSQLQRLTHLRNLIVPFSGFFSSSLPVFILPWNTSCFSLPLRSFLGRDTHQTDAILSPGLAGRAGRASPLAHPAVPSALPFSHKAPMVSSAVLPPSESSQGFSRWDKKKPRRDEKEEPFHPDPRILSKSARD